MNLEKRVEQLEGAMGAAGQETVTDIFLVGLAVPGVILEVAGYSSGKQQWVRLEGESVEELRGRACAEVNRTRGPVVMFGEQYAWKASHGHSKRLTKPPILEHQRQGGTVC